MYTSVKIYTALSSTFLQFYFFKQNTTQKTHS